MAIALNRSTEIEENSLVLNRRLFDYYDRRILELLEQNSRIPYTEIARILGVSEGTVRRRINDLVDNGIIVRFTIETRGP